MTLLFCDGFDHIDEPYETVKWDTAANHFFEAAIGRTGGWGFRMYYPVTNLAYITKNVGTDCETIILGYACKLSAFNDIYSILELKDGATTQVSVRVNTSGGLNVYRGTTTLLGSSDNSLITTNTFFYLEIKVKISNTVGTVEIRLNGSASPIVNLTSQDTMVSANAYVNTILLASRGFYQYIDDLVVCDISGAVNNDFLGDVAITTLYPTSDGTNTDFTCSTGTDHYALVDEAQLSADTDHNESSTVGHKDTYGMTTFSGSGTVLGVQICATVKNTDAGSMNVRTLAISGASPTETEGSDFALSATMKSAMTIHEKEPIDAVAWTAAKINAAEFGLKVQS